MKAEKRKKAETLPLPHDQFFRREREGSLKKKRDNNIWEPEKEADKGKRETRAMGLTKRHKANGLQI